MNDRRTYAGGGEYHSGGPAAGREHHDLLPDVYRDSGEINHPDTGRIRTGTSQLARGRSAQPYGLSRPGKAAGENVDLGAGGGWNMLRRHHLAAAAGNGRVRG